MSSRRRTSCFRGSYGNEARRSCFQQPPDFKLARPSNQEDKSLAQGSDFTKKCPLNQEDESFTQASAKPPNSTKDGPSNRKREPSAKSPNLTKRGGPSSLKRASSSRPSGLTVGIESRYEDSESESPNHTESFRKSRSKRKSSCRNNWMKRPLSSSHTCVPELKNKILMKKRIGDSSMRKTDLNSLNETDSHNKYRSSSDRGSSGSKSQGGKYNSKNNRQSNPRKSLTLGLNDNRLHEFQSVGYDYDDPSSSGLKEKCPIVNISSETDQGKDEDSSPFSDHNKNAFSTPAYCPSVSEGTQRVLNMSALNESLLHGVKSNTACGTSKTSSHCKDILLIEDTYDPGLIEDCVNGSKKFNKVSFGMFFEECAQIPERMPRETPITLLEAFDKRISLERDNMFKVLRSPKDDRSLKKKEICMYFTCKPQTDLNAALNHLFEAESLCNTLRRSTKDTNAEECRKARAEVDYDIEVHHNRTPLVGGCDMVVESFMGVTKPRMKLN